MITTIVKNKMEFIYTISNKYKIDRFLIINNGISNFFKGAENYRLMMMELIVYKSLFYTFYRL